MRERTTSYIIVLPGPNYPEWLKSGRMDLFYRAPQKPHCVTLTVCEAAYRHHTLRYSWIHFLSASALPSEFQVTLRDLKSISVFANAPGWSLWLRRMSAAPRARRQPMDDGCFSAPGMPCREETCRAPAAILWVADKRGALEWSGAALALAGPGEQGVRRRTQQWYFWM